MTAVSGSFLLILPESNIGIVILTNINSGAFNPATLAGMRGIVDILQGQKETVNYTPIEWAFHLILGLGFLLSVIKFIRKSIKWQTCKRPLKFAPQTRTLIKLMFGLTWPFAIIFAVTKLFGMTLLGMFEVLPFLGLVLILSIPIDWANSFLQAVLTPYEKPKERNKDNSEFLRGS